MSDPNLRHRVRGTYSMKWLRTSGITPAIPVSPELHNEDEMMMHPEERRKQWRRAMQAG